MRILLIILLVLGWHFSTTPFVPAKAGKASLLWPFAKDSQSLLPAVLALPHRSNNPITLLLAGAASLGFLGAGLALFGILVPVGWFSPLLILASSTSILLFLSFPGIWSLIPIAVDVALIWGLLGHNLAEEVLGSVG